MWQSLVIKLHRSVFFPDVWVEEQLQLSPRVSLQNKWDWSWLWGLESPVSVLSH